MSKKQFSHLCLEHRQIIKRMIIEGATAKEIGKVLGMSPTSISREVKRNRVVEEPKQISEGSICNDCLNFTICSHKRICGSLLCNQKCKGCKQIKECKYYVPYTCNKTDHWPFTCHGCFKRSCPLKRYYYDEEKADDIAEHRLKYSRSGADITNEDYIKQNTVLISSVRDKKQSIHHVLKANEELFHCSEKTIYRRIESNVYGVKTMDLPRKPGLKPRKRIKPKYNYTHDDYLNRKGHLYSDWLVYAYKNQCTNNIQMDFLGVPHKSKKEILVFTIKGIQFTLLYLFENTTSEKVADVFDQIEKQLGIDDFIKIFGVIITDRDVVFDNYDLLEFDKDGIKRCSIFYADPSASYQKPQVENSNGQLRIPLPKHALLDEYTQEELYEVASNMNSRILNKIDDRTPYDLFVEIYGEKIAKKLNIHKVKPKDVNISPIHNKR